MNYKFKTIYCKFGEFKKSTKTDIHKYYLWLFSHTFYGFKAINTVTQSSLQLYCVIHENQSCTRNFLFEANLVVLLL